MKTLIISLFFLLAAATTWAQTSNDTIVVAPGPSGMYFYHIVQKGENFQSLSQKFGVAQGQLESLNNKQTAEPYELIKIPISQNNIVQSGSASAHAGLTPLYHKVLKGETLFRVGKLYGDLPLSSLRAWNGLQGNNIGVGEYLVVGWLKKQPVPSPNTTTSPAPAPDPAPAVATNNRPPGETATPPAPGPSDEGHSFLREVIASEKQRVKKASQKRHTDKPVADPLLTAATKADPQPQNAPRSVSEPLLAAAPPKKEETGASPLPDNAREHQPETTAVKPDPSTPSAKTGTAKATNPFEKMLNQISNKNKKQPEETPKAAAPARSPQQAPAEQVSPAATQAAEKAPAPEAQISTPPPPLPAATGETDTAALTLSRASVFSELYLAQTQGEKLVTSKKGAAGWFKSNVKPGSKKYYALCDNLPRGTIVKVVNPINNKFVYVKVLAPIPKQKENYNLIIKLSDAAMNDLGTNQPRFWSKIIYPKLNENTAN